MPDGVTEELGGRIANLVWAFLPSSWKVKAWGPFCSGREFRLLVQRGADQSFVEKVDVTAILEAVKHETMDELAERIAARIREKAL